VSLVAVNCSTSSSSSSSSSTGSSSYCCSRSGSSSSSSRGRSHSSSSSSSSRSGMLYGITQCYLPPGSSDFLAFNSAEAGTRFSDPEGCKTELT